MVDGSSRARYLWLLLLFHPRAAEELLWTNITAPGSKSADRVAFLISGHERTFLAEWRSARENVVAALESEGVADEGGCRIRGKRKHPDF